MIEEGTIVEVLQQHPLTRIYGHYAEVVRLKASGNRRSGNRWLVKFFPRKKRHKPHFSEVYEFQLKELSPLEQLARGGCGHQKFSEVRTRGLS